jgi:hypothetical protein
VAAARPADPADVATLRAQFAVWAANDARFQATAEGNSLLAELNRCLRTCRRWERWARGFWTI